jgi:hypothetical protein
MIRRDMLSHIAAVSAAPAILAATTGTAGAVTSGGLVFKDCYGYAYNSAVNKSSDEEPEFKCDFLVKNDEKHFKCEKGVIKIFVLIKNCVIKYKQGKGQGKGEWKTVKCPEQYTWVDCDFDWHTKILHIRKFSCKDEKSKDWVCYPKPIDCGKSEDSTNNGKKVVLLVLLLIELKKRLEKNPYDDCKDVIKRIVLLIVVLIVIFVPKPKSSY